MKKLFVFLAVFSVFISVITSTVMAQDAEEKIQEDAEKKGTDSAKIIQYDLAYPGILPDHPLYKLKVLRNKLTALLINDPKKKVDFYLLQADKGIHAGAMLVDKKEVELAKDTLFKAENNITLLTYEFGKFQRKPNSDFFNKLETASLKHQELIKLLMKRVSTSDRKSFERVLNFSKTNLDTIIKFKNKKFFQVK